MVVRVWFKTNEDNHMTDELVNKFWQIHWNNYEF